MIVTRRRAPTASVVTTWLARVAFVVSFVLGTAAGSTWLERDSIEEREGEGEDGKIAEALALEAASARRAGPGPDGLRAELAVPRILAPRHDAPLAPTWPRPRRTPPPDDDEPAGC